MAWGKGAIAPINFGLSEHFLLAGKFSFLIATFEDESLVWGNSGAKLKF